MPYVERVTKAGNTIEIERYFTSRYKKKGISREIRRDIPTGTGKAWKRQKRR